MKATDNLSGVDAAYHNKSPNLGYQSYFRFQSPSGNQNMWVYLTTPVAGTATNGTWQGVGYLPQYSEAGTWTLTYGQFLDAAGNVATYNTASLQALGVPTSLEVILPSLVPDGTIPAPGGTVQDNVFGNRAQVTVPPGVLTQPTTVSIDVLSSDLHLPVPAGFTTNGTNFVNIKLDPEPTPPFPAPGLTLVLPLLNQMVPGTSLTLYRVDPVSGYLTPESGIAGRTRAACPPHATSVTLPPTASSFGGQPCGSLPYLLLVDENPYSEGSCRFYVIAGYAGSCSLCARARKRVYKLLS